MRKIFLTGATGVMGSAGLRHLAARPDEYEVTVLARRTPRNLKKLKPWLRQGVKVIWGDLMDAGDVARGVSDTDIVLHVGGMVSPMADAYPEKTEKVNISSMRHIIDVAKVLQNPPAIVYIGSVAQYGHRAVPEHWGAVGDFLNPALYDAYAYSKTEAERLLAESGLPRWVSLRQTGILHSGLLMKASDPITFHVPVKGVLEWVTAEDSGRLLERVCRTEVPESFWNHFYNIGGGKEYRLTNYEFESQLLHAMGCPPPEKVFDARWFATDNFHGFWFKDSDLLEDILHFRGSDTPTDYFRKMKKELPFYFSLAPLAPAFIIKAFMKHVASTPGLGPLHWYKSGNRGRIDAFFHGIHDWRRLPHWEEIDLSRPSEAHETPAPPSYTWKAIAVIISRRRGHLLGMEGGSPTLREQHCAEGGSPKDSVNPDEILSLRCGSGHEFSLRARTLAEGGHWCPVCLRLRAFPHS